MGRLAMTRILPLCLLLAGCATADRAQFADGATTWYGLSQGYAEANPLLSGLSGPEILAVKLAATQAAKLTPTEYCEPLLYWLTAQGFGLALWNLGVFAGSGPAALPVIAGVWAWQHEHWKDDAVKTCKNPWNRQPTYEIVRVKLPDGQIIEP
jgi:hypothetical protein